ncbi:MAG: gluconate 2-dehydrogenase subunit 3 family protein [Acidobacteriota bacterium]|nr:gluconate 2-dehydrogenase subunit 3 family protein [Acidobacteriota bacterium]
MSSDPLKPEIRCPLTRRQMLERIALALTASGAAPFEFAWGEHVHGTAREEREKTGAYKPKLFKPHEYRTIQQLAELIIPADEHSGSALEAGAPEFIDLLCSQNPELADIYTGGLLWLDAQMRQQHGASFLESTAEQQTSLLDRLVEEGDPEKVEGARATRYGASEDYQGFSDYRIHPVSDLAPGVRFFEWLRKMIVDAFYTSPIGIQDVGYQGNIAVSKYEVPEAIIQEALRRSPFGGA